MQNEQGTKGTEIAHVLFLDIVAHSTKSTEVQAQLIQRLTACVRATPTFAKANAEGSVLPIPTGDGMALLFFADVAAPARCAIELSCEAGEIEFRMGIHSGLVQRQLDISGKENVVGEGISTAFRVMEFGDAGHILVSSQYANWLKHSDEWAHLLTEVGEGVAKHGLRMKLFALVTGEAGSSRVPTKLKSTPASVGSVPLGQKIVLLYKRDADPDEAVLEMLERELKANGHEVFTDRHIQVGAAWAKQIEKRIREADAVVALVSPRAMQSEMIEYEMLTAQDEFDKSGKPIILPVRLPSEDPSEGPIHSIIAPLNQFEWHSSADDHRLVLALLSAINEPLKPAQSEIKLEPVGGAVPPDSPFYIQRAADHEFAEAIRNRESIILIKGARQMGKTSMEGQGTKLVKDLGWRIGLTDFQKLGTAQLATDEVFYKLLAATIARQLGFKYDFANEWMDVFGSTLNMENFLREALDQSDQPLVWFMDEVDKLFGAPLASDFFGLVRSWHNSRSTEPGGPWDKLVIVIAYATEAHLFIQDLNQSPFNVGRRLDLEDFNLQQFVDLNGRYGGPLVSYQQIQELHDLIGGQPFLTRRALDTLARHKMSFEDLMANASDDDGPFGDHLKRILISVTRWEPVSDAMKEVLQTSRCSNIDAFYRLYAAGIVKKNSSNEVVPRTKLYGAYLSGHLL